MPRIFKMPYSKRIKKFQAILEENGIDLALIRQNADLFYFTGTVQDAHLFIPKAGEAHLYVYRSLKRAKEESPLKNISALKGLSQLEKIINGLGFSNIDTLGLELDVLPTGLYLKYQSFWPKAKTKDISRLIRFLRKNKDEGEIHCIKAASKMAEESLKKVPEFLKAGMSELELSSLVEAQMRRLGHPGILRMRMWNQEIGMGQIVSGSSGAIPSWTSTPVGGKGPHPAFGMGASFKRIKKGEVVSIDIGGWAKGYCCDVTRPFVLGRPSQKVNECFLYIKELIDKLHGMLKPGVVCGDLYEFSIEFMEKRGLNENFMGMGTERVPFVGHGLGIELDEYPFLSRGNKMELEERMVLAIEPKIILPDLGVIGLEDTFLIEKNGAIRLTGPEQNLTII